MLRRPFIFFLLVFWLLSPRCFGQENALLLRKIDSLKKERPKSFKEDTTRFKIYIGIGRASQKLLRFEEAEKYVDSAIALSIKINYKRGEAEGNNTMAIIKSKMAHFEEGFNFAKKSVSIYEALGDTVDIALALQNLGLNCGDRGDVSNALAYLKKAVYYNERSGNLKSLGNVFNSIGDIYRKKGNYIEALEFYLKALKIFENLQQKAGMASCFHSLSMIYSAMNNNDEALAHEQKSLILREELGDKRATASSYINIGNIYAAQKKMPDALLFLEKGLDMAQQSGNKMSVANAYGNIGAVYQESGAYREALRYYLGELKIRESVNTEDGLDYTYNNLGAVSMDLKKFADAEKYLNKALHYAKKAGDRFSAGRALDGMSELYSYTGDFKKALACYKEHIRYRDSLVNEENTKKTVQALMQYDFDKKTAADSIKNAEAKRVEEINHQSQIRNQKLYTYAGIAGFLIMIVVAGISFIAFRNKKKTNVEIERQKLIVEMKQKEVLDSILYAKRIQTALITNEQYIIKRLKILKAGT